MNYQKETFTFSDSNHFQLFHIKQKQEMLHCHNCLELNIIEQGTGKYIIGGRLYAINKGDIFVINNSERHLAIADNDALDITVLVFDSDYIYRNQYGKEYLKPFFQRNSNFSNQITSNAPDYASMFQLFSSVKEEFNSEESGWQMMIDSSAYMLLAIIYRHYHKHQELTSNDTQNQFSRISSILSYIDTHFSEEISLEDLASISSFSKTYLCKYFKKITDYSVAKIAMESGFGTVSYFNRQFKSTIGMTPLQFRKNK